jgi:hypothetical protein
VREKVRRRPYQKQEEGMMEEEDRERKGIART